MAASTIFKRIRYGTAIKPTIVQRVRHEFPSRSSYPLIDPATFVNHERPFPSLKALSPRLTESASNITGYPSVSTVIGATDSLGALYNWQLRMIHTYGIDGFNTIMTERMASGRIFHSVVQTLLEELVQKGEITSTAEEVLERGEKSVKYKDKLVGYLSGIREYLKTLNINPLMRMEKSAHHPILCYNGRFDAIIEMDGELTLVDWKTINAQSEKSRSEGEKTTSDLYSNPVQIAAYVAAVNSDPAYAFLPPIKRAAVVLTYEDGRGVEIVSMGEEDIEQYFDEFCHRINRFWWMVENEPERGGYVNLVYNPCLVETENKSEAADKSDTEDKYVASSSA